MLKDEVLFAWWSLSSTQGIGNIALNKIREQLPTFSHLVESSAQDLILLGLKPQLAYVWANNNRLESTQNAFVIAGWQKNKCLVFTAGMRFVNAR
jgi:hypothetical protein